MRTRRTTPTIPIRRSNTCCAAGATAPDKPAIWDLKYRDVRVRNVPTNIRNNFTGGTERYGNSIFIFEIANLCIAHLGHLHHTLTQAQLNAIGRVDVVMAPVDGSYTLDLDGIMEVLTALKAQLIIPMHFFGWYTSSGSWSGRNGTGRSSEPRSPRWWYRRRRCRKIRKSWCCRDFKKSAPVIAGVRDSA